MLLRPGHGVAFMQPERDSSVTEGTERLVRRGLVAAALEGLALGLAASFPGRSTAAQWL
jgi:hypothetical protein